MISLAIDLISSPSAALKGIQDKNGDFFHTSFLNKPVVFVSNPDYIKEIFTLEVKGDLDRQTLYNAKKPVFGDSIFNSKGETWTNQRRLMQPYFNKDGIEKWRQVVIDEIALLVSKLNASNPDQVNLSVDLKKTIQRIIIRILFGRMEFGQDEAQLIRVVDTVAKGLLPHFVTATLGSEKLKYLFWFQNKRTDKAIKEFVDYVYSKIDATNSSGEDNLIATLYQAKDKKTGYSMGKELLKDEAVTLFLAGQDTTINTLIWFFYLIGKHESVHQKITDELQAHKDEPLTLETIGNYPYTKAVLYETLRLYPQATALSRNVVNPILIGGKPIEKDATVIVNIYAMHHDKKLWEDPETFLPERFLNANDANYTDKAFLPFGGGLHNCIGRHLAEMEMMIVVIMLLREYKIEAKNTMNVKASTTLKADRDLIVTLTPVGN